MDIFIYMGLLEVRNLAKGAEVMWPETLAKGCNKWRLCVNLQPMYMYMYMKMGMWL
jgi:hypothetical protein